MGRYKRQPTTSAFPPLSNANDNLICSAIGTTDIADIIRHSKADAVLSAIAKRMRSCPP